MSSNEDKRIRKLVSKLQNRIEKGKGLKKSAAMAIELSLALTPNHSRIGYSIVHSMNHAELYRAYGAIHTIRKQLRKKNK